MQLYDTLCLYTEAWKDKKSYWVPVLEYPHIDEPELGLDGVNLHWHLDYRFMTEEELFVFNFRPDAQPGVLLPKVCTLNNYLEYVKTRIEQRPLLRDFRSIVFIGAARYEFEKNYVDRKIIGNKCPHHGFDVTKGQTVEIENEDHWICPGHSLCVSKRTNKVKLTCK